MANINYSDSTMRPVVTSPYVQLNTLVTHCLSNIKIFFKEENQNHILNSIAIVQNIYIMN